ncbi:MAG: potassium channel family protein [Bacillota bacterium]
MAQRRQYAVIGLGRFGSSVARSLHNLGHEVLAIDSDASLVQEMADCCTHAVEADATDENALRDLGLRNFDVVVVAIGDDIQSSILSTVILKDIGCKYVIAKAQNELHGKVLYKTGADRVIFPERDMGVRVAHNLISSNILDYIELAPEYSIVEIQVPDSMAGRSLRQLELRSAYNVNVIGIKRNGHINILPKADDKVQRGDVLVVLGANVDIHRLEQEQ